MACTTNKFTVGISGRILNQLTSEKITAEREACNSRQLDDFYDGRFFFRGNNVSRRRFVNPAVSPSSRHVIRDESDILDDYDRYSRDEQPINSSVISNIGKYEQLGELVSKPPLFFLR